MPKGYTHQGWLSEDQTFLYFNDELDEHVGPWHPDVHRRQ